MKTKQFYTIFALLFGLIFHLNSIGQPSEKSQFDFYASTYGIGSNMLPLSDGNYLIIGSNGSDVDYTRSDMVVLKTDGNFNPLWGKSYAAPNYNPNPFRWYFWGNYVGSSSCQYSVPHMEYAVDAVEVDDGYIVLGTYDNFVNTWPFCGANNHTAQSTFDYVVMKISKSNGSVIWAKNYGGNANQMPTSIQKTSDGGFIVGGFTKGGALYNGNWGVHPYFLKLAANGNTQWTTIQQGFNFQLLAGVVMAGFKFPIIELENGGYAYAASTGNETYIVKLESDGTEDWAKVVSHGGGNGGYLAPYVEDVWGLGLAAGYITQAFTPCLKEITSGPDQGNLMLGANGNFSAAALIGILFNSGNNGYGGDGTGGFISANLGMIVELASSGDYVNSSMFWRETGNYSGDISDIHISDIDILDDGDVLITGVINSASYIMKYDKNVTGTFFSPTTVAARNVNAFNYSTIPFNYDMPSSNIIGSNAVTLADNFKLSTTPINASGDNCLSSFPVKAFSTTNPGVQTASNINLVHNSYPSSNLAINGTDLSVTRNINCNNSSNTRSANSIIESSQQKLIGTSTDLSVFPNPVANGNTFSLTWKSERDEQYNLFIIDVRGKIVKEISGISQIGQNTKELNLDLAKGMYCVELQSEGQIFTSKLVSQ